MCQVRLQVKYSLSGLDLRRTQPSHSWLFAARGVKPVEGDGEYPPTVPWRNTVFLRPTTARRVSNCPDKHGSRYRSTSTRREASPIGSSGSTEKTGSSLGRFPRLCQPLQ